MTLFDPPSKEPREVLQTKAAETAGAGPAGHENKERKSDTASPPRCREELPPVWRDSSLTSLCTYGPLAAAFEEPPPANPEPPEPEEQVGEALTERQLAFCERYVERPVAAPAAREAGYAASTAGKQASRLLKHPLVMRRILELRRKRHLEQTYRRETLLDKFDVVFGDAVERKDFHAAIKALTMQARLARVEEAMPGARPFRRFPSDAEQLIWETLTRLEQKLTEISVGDFPGAAAAVPAKSFRQGAADEATKLLGWGPPEQRADFAMDRLRRKRKK